MDLKENDVLCFSDLQSMNDKKKTDGSINNNEKESLEFNKEEIIRLEYFLSEIKKKKK